MDLLARIFGGPQLYAGTPDPFDDFWYRDVPSVTGAGQRVDGETAQKVSAWYRGRDILATVVAMLPFPVYERLPNDGGATPATDHPLYDVLHDTPNSWQDSFQWRREKVFNIIDCGWSYDFIVPGARGFAHELHPIHPSLVKPEQIKNGPNRGRYLFTVRDPDSAQTKVYTQDEIFYLRGAGGKGILEYARSSIGTAMAAGSYASNIFSTGTLNGGVIEVPGVLDEEPARRLARSMVTKPGEWHLPKVLEQGAKWAKNDQAMTPEDAQMLLSQKFSVDEMARWLGVPRQMLENSDPSFGNAEQFWQGFLTVGMGGWLSMFEFGVNGQLITAPKRFFAQFTRQALLRGDFKDRIEGLVLAAGGPIMTADEARAVEDLKKLGGKSGELRENQNVTGKPAAAPTPSSAPPKPRPQPNQRAEAIVVASAGRLLRKEVKAMQALAVKHASDQDAFAAAVAEFYAGHMELVEQTLLMSTAEAERYCAGQASQICAGWVPALEIWKLSDYAEGLAALALEEAA